MWRDYWRRWLWNASGKKTPRQRNIQSSNTIVYLRGTCKCVRVHLSRFLLRERFLLHLVSFHVPPRCSQSRCNHILEPFTHNAYFCWNGLWGSGWHVDGRVCWDWGQGFRASPALCVAHDSFTLSEWPPFPFTFCLPLLATNWQLMCTHDQLRGAL